MVEGWNHIKLFFFFKWPHPFLRWLKGGLKFLNQGSLKKVMAKRKFGNQIAKIIPNHYFNVLSVNVNCLACFIHAYFGPL
jgi:hypothetical protein